MDYINSKCTSCGKIFTKDDDVVVCPECGSPMHRECYEKEGACPNAFRHGNYEYKADQQNNSGGNETVRCPNCGTDNPKDSFYCNKCGAAIDSRYRSNPYGNTRQYDSNGRDDPGFSGTFGGTPVDFSDPLAGIPKDTVFDNNVSASEMAKYVKQNTPYFSRVFYNISVFNKSKFNFGACLFSGGYLLYRKMYKLGAFVAALEAALLIFMQYVSYYITSSIEYTKVYDSLMNVMQSGGGINQVMDILSSLTPAQIFIMYLPSIINFLYIILMFTIGFTANRLYYIHCRKEISKIKTTSATKEEAENNLQIKGGVNLAIAIVVFICYLIINYLPGFIVGM